MRNPLKCYTFTIAGVLAALLVHPVTPAAESDTPSPKAEVTPSMTGLPPDPGTAVYRIKCGQVEADGHALTIGNATWSADRAYKDGADYGAIGGNVGPRIAEIPFSNSRTPELYRSERFGMKAYVFKVEDGTYNLRLYFAESFESNFKAGMRIFDVSVDGKPALQDFDPFTEGGGFARTVVMEIRGVRATGGKLNIEFHAKRENPAICGIEVFRTTPETAFAVQKLSTPAPTPELPADWAHPRPGVKTRKLLFVGNSFFIFWAMPETIATMVNCAQDVVQLETQRCCYGGKRLAWLWEGDPEQNARKAVESGKYDEVVILLAIEAEVPWDRGMEILDKAMALIRKNNARPVLHWTDVVPPEEKEKRLADLKRLCQKHQGVLLPVRLAWDQGAKERPELVWHNFDGLHPSLHQAYLTACLHYALWTGKSPKGHPHPYVIDRGLKIEDKPAAFLQDLAERIMKENGLIQ
jgi:hypothetical protein